MLHRDADLNILVYLMEFRPSGGQHQAHRSCAAIRHAVSSDLTTHLRDWFPAITKAIQRSCDSVPVSGYLPRGWLAAEGPPSVK